MVCALLLLLLACLAVVGRTNDVVPAVDIVLVRACCGVVVLLRVGMFCGVVVILCKCGVVTFAKGLVLVLLRKPSVRGAWVVLVVVGVKQFT